MSTVVSRHRRFSLAAVLVLPVTILTPTIGLIPGLPAFRLEWAFIAVLLMGAPQNALSLLPRAARTYFRWAFVLAVVASIVVAILDLVLDRFGSVSLQILYFATWPLIAFLSVVAGLKAVLRIGPRLFKRCLWASGIALVLLTWAQAFNIGPVNEVISPLFLGDISREKHLQAIGFGRAFGTVGNANALACLLVVIAILGAALELTQRDTLKPRSLVLASGMLATIFPTLSRTGLIMAGFAGTGLLMKAGFRSRIGQQVRRYSAAAIENWTVRVVVLFLLIAVSQFVIVQIAALPESRAGARLNVASAVDPQGTFVQRIEKWQAALDGTDPAAVIAGWYGTQSDYSGIDNELLKVLLSFGVIGLGSLFLLWLACWRVARRAPAGSQRLAYLSVVLCFLFSIPAYFFLSYQLPVVLCLGLGGLVGVAAMQQQERLTDRSVTAAR